MLQNASASITVTHIGVNAANVKILSRLKITVSRAGPQASDFDACERQKDSGAEGLSTVCRFASVSGATIALA